MQQMKGETRGHGGQTHTRLLEAAAGIAKVQLAPANGTIGLEDGHGPGRIASTLPKYAQVANVPLHAVKAIVLHFQHAERVKVPTGKFAGEQIVVEDQLLQGAIAQPAQVVRESTR